MRLPNPNATSGRRPPEQLDDGVLAQLQTVFDEAAALDDREDHLGALRVWERVWDLLPEPTREWAWSATIYGGIGESLSWLGDHAMAELAFRFALRCPGGEQPVTLARIAQCVERRGDDETAARFWERAEAAQSGITELARQED
ncbi:hypothetical protein [Enemella dayhoffiae]|uniref:hypothetical protein n=1 Tax=Enemella dayhoffiae TaxID=2016507 RepID=UPI0011407966|nr:hypothetical protein [Enemella dayhoffiae]